MKITGFICEFNPLHDGHRHFIRKAEEATGSDYLIALMSGDFVQRGEPAILPMYERTKAALDAGADLVLQLPAVFSTASAAYFAEGGVRILHELGCVDALVFGAEGGADDDITETLAEIAAYMEDNRDSWQPLLRTHLREGKAYAAARAEAMKESGCPADGLSDLLVKPNNQLALAYMTAIRRIGSSMKPVAIPRDMTYAASSDIRTKLRSSSAAKDQTCLFPDDFSLLLKDRLMSRNAADLAGCLDITQDLAQRIKNRQNEFVNWSNFTDLLHTKEMTRARISRCLTHILLDIKKDDPLLAEGAAPKTILTRTPSFVRILGFRRKAQPLLARLKESSSVTLQTQLPPDLDDRAADLYESVRTDKYALPFTESHRQQPVII